MEKEALIRVFDRQAKQYATKQEPKSQQQWRRKLLQEAKGEVLELAVGAGANFPFYPPGVHVTATDFSKEMLMKARRTAVEYGVVAEFKQADIETLEFADHSFDTIVSTLSFCSYENPVQVLNNLQRWCKPDGKILFMEHGISSNRVLAVAQKLFDPLLYRMVGCHHTRNIPNLIRDSGLAVTKIESHWIDMVHLIWTKPNVIH